MEKVNREFLVRRKIPRQVVQKIIQFRPVIKRSIAEWTLMVIMYFLVHNQKKIDIFFEEDFRVQIHVTITKTFLTISNDDPDDNIYFHQSFPSHRSYPTTSALRLLLHMLKSFTLRLDFNRFSDRLVIHKEELLSNIPKLKLYWKRITTFPNKINPEEQSFLHFLHNIPKHHPLQKKLITFPQYLDLFPTITQQQALQNLLQYD